MTESYPTKDSIIAPCGPAVARTNHYYKYILMGTLFQDSNSAHRTELMSRNGRGMTPSCHIVLPLAVIPDTMVLNRVLSDHRHRPDMSENWKEALFLRTHGPRSLYQVGGFTRHRYLSTNSLVGVSSSLYGRHKERSLHQANKTILTVTTTHILCPVQMPVVDFNGGPAAGLWVLLPRARLFP